MLKPVDGGLLSVARLLRTPFELTRSSGFSYECGKCNRCCTGKDIPLNPYEGACLSRHLGLSTTDFLERHTQAGGAVLARRSDDSCVFLGDQGCSVHEARPLACRLYPLGRRRSYSGEERFAELRPHPETQGTYGKAGTVDDFLDDQGVAPFVEHADLYGELLPRVVGALRNVEGAEASSENRRRTPVRRRRHRIRLLQAARVWPADRRERSRSPPRGVPSGAGLRNG